MYGTCVVVLGAGQINSIGETKPGYFRQPRSEIFVEQPTENHTEHTSLKTYQT